MDPRSQRRLAGYRAAMEKAVGEFRPHRIMHLAAESHVDRSITGAADFIQTNVIGTFTLLEASRAYWSALDPPAKERFRFLHVSTDEVYGSLGEEGVFTEDTPYDPSSPYSASKASSDHLAKAWQRTYGLPVVVSNCSNNYGPYQFPEKLVPLMILALWIGVYPKPFLEYIQQPVNTLVRQVRPDYVIPGTVAPAQAERAER